MECLVSGLNVVSCTLGAAELPWFPLSSEAGLTAENFANFKKMKAANKYEKVDKMEDTNTQNRVKALCVRTAPGWSDRVNSRRHI